MFKKSLLAALLAGTIGSIAMPASAVVYVRVAPPEPRAEVVPAPRHGYTWVEGHWVWNNHRHVWVSGKWMRERHGYHYNQARWQQHSNGRWYMTPGGWKRGDADGDGVRNSQDRAPNNPNRS